MGGIQTQVIECVSWSQSSTVQVYVIAQLGEALCNIRNQLSVFSLERIVVVSGGFVDQIVV